MKKIHPSLVITMIGGIIGAGIFGIPYVFMRSGVLTGLIFSVFLVAVSIVTGLYFAVVAAETPGKHRLVGYAKKHLGPKTSYVLGLMVLVEFLGSLLVYLLLGGTFLAAIFGGNPAMWTIAFFIVVAVILLFPLKKSDGIDRWLTAALVAVVAAIILLVLPKVVTANFSTVNWQNWFMPYGILLYAFGGTAVIPEIVELARKKESSAFHAVILGTIIAAFITILFGVVVVGVTGNATTENAMVGLALHFGRPIIILGSVFGLLAMFTQFIITGSNIRDQFIYDFKFPRTIAWAITVGIPLAAYWLGARDFVGIIGFLGATAGAVIAFIIVLMGRKIMAKSKEFPVLRLFAFPLMLLFVVGLVAEIISFF